MLKVMIVDDDKLIVNDLRKIIDWKSHGFEIAATACSGKQGILKHAQYRPQVIFTDIKMPVMDGLEMVRKIRAVDNEVRFVILSAYGEFEYAKQAIGLGASDYILKYQLIPETIVKVLRTLKEDIMKHSKTAFLTILNIIQVFLDSSEQDFVIMSGKLDEAFDMYTDMQGEWNLNALADGICNLIEGVYRRYGKQYLFARPERLTGELLPEWTKEQLKLIARWDAEKGSQIPPLIFNVRFYIEQNYNQKDLNIQKIADTFSISPSWLSILFKKETGRTVNEYITEVRINNAKELVAQGKYRVYEIAEKVGYNSHRYFSKIYFEATGQSPHGIRKDAKK